MNIVNFIFQFLGSLCFILYGMKMMSSGVQKSCGVMIQNAVSSISKNKFHALFTGVGVSVLLQSSAATATMGVSFVDAGILTLSQAVPLIFGANIGTTFTLWVIAFFGYSFDILTFALPIFATGFLLRSIKKIKKENIGEALIGFGLLFIGVHWLNNLVMSSEGLSKIFDAICAHEIISVVAGVLAGIVFTAVINSSSLSITVVIALAFYGLIKLPMTIALVIGTEIGSSINVVISARKARLTGKRAAFIHVLFNIIISIFALVFFKPLLAFFDLIGADEPEKDVVFYIPLLHSSLKIFGALICVPIQKILISFAVKTFPEKETSSKKEYKIEIPSKGMKESVAGFIVRGEKEISDMAEIVFGMFDTAKNCLFSQKKSFLEEEFVDFKETEDYVDEMKEQLSRYIVAIQSLAINDVQANELSRMLQIVNDLEDMSDDCYTIALLIKRGIEKNLAFEDEDLALLIPYTNLATQFIEFIRENIHKKTLTKEQLIWAEDIENQIDETKNNLKRVARKRLENGSDVKSELLYIDIVRQIEKVGDRAFSISEAIKN